MVDDSRMHPIQERRRWQFPVRRVIPRPGWLIGLACLLGAWTHLTASPLKVFILAGQSNMEGQAVVDLEGRDYNEGRGTLAQLLLDPAKAPLFRHLQVSSGNWARRDDVWVWYQRENAPLLHGTLGVGYSVHGDSHHFGPELQFRHILGHHLRRDLAAPKLPVVIGELTGPWVTAPAEWTTLRRAQAAAAARPEFAGNVLFVETHDFVRRAEDSPNPTHGHHEFDNAEIQAAYNREKAGYRYDRVERRLGNSRPNIWERAYAMTNPQEYFAECTEAFYCRNDFFPFTRAELQEEDPGMFDLLVKLWGDPGQERPAK